MSEARRRDPRTALSLFYAAYFANMGILIPFLPPWLRAQGLAPSAIGILLATQPLLKLVAPWTWGALADRTGERRVPLIAALLLSASALAVLGLATPASFAALLALVALYAAGSAPALPYAEATSLEQADRHGFDYGTVRLWGSLTFIVASVGFGVVVDRVGAPAGFLAGAGFLIAALACVALWPAAERHGPARPRAPARAGADRSTVRLFVACAAMQASHGGYYAFYSIRLQDLGHDAVVIGAMWGFGVLCEVALLTRADRLVERFGTGTVLSASLVAAAVRWTAIGSTGHLAVLVPAQALHALTYAAFHVAALREVHRRFPPGRRATGQALYSGLTYGLGTLVGTLAAGRLAEAIGLPGLFLVSAATAAAGLAVLTGSIRPRR